MAEPYLSRYLHARGSKRGIPVAGTFELTPRCNFRCKMCYVHLDEAEARARGRELTTGQWLDIARQAKDAGMMFLLLTGGEPFLRPDFLELYGELRKMGFLISVNTNGSLIKGEILEEIRKNPPMRVNMTLYGGCEETYEALCGVRMFHQVTRNLDALLEAGVAVRLNASLTPYNRQDVEKIFAFAKERNLHIRYTAYMNPPVRVDEGKTGTQQHRFTPEEAAACTVMMDRLQYSQADFRRRAENMQKGILERDDDDCEGIAGSKLRCRAGRTSFWLTWDGRMLPCGMMTEPAVDVLAQGFRAGWEQIKGLTDAIRMPSQCAACPHQKVCSVCGAMCQNETGRFDGRPEYICRMTHSLLGEYKQALSQMGEELK